MQSPGNEALDRILELERAVGHLQARLRDAISSSPEAIAYLEDGVVVRANPAWAACFGFGNADSVAGLPLMDLFAESGRSALKDALQSAARADPGAPPLSLELQTEIAGESPLIVELSPLPGSVPGRLQIAVHGKGASAETGTQIEALEREQSRLATAVQTLDGDKRQTSVVPPLAFASAAAERLNRPLGGSIRALVALRPVDLAQASRILGPLGIAAVGGDVSGILAPILAEGDVATRLDDLNVLALVARPDEASVREWIESTLRVLGSHIFEAEPHSTHIGFVGGYATADGIRQLEALVRLAIQEAKGMENTVHRANPETQVPATETAKVSWDVFIPEAFQDRRFAIALTPIQDLARGSTFYEAGPRLLDRGGREIHAVAFYRPAADLGLLTNVERRFLGYAFVAQMQLQLAGKSTRMLVPLSAGALDDPGLPALLRSLDSEPEARSAMETLVIELEENDIVGRIRDVERMSAELAQLGCGIGIRGFVPSRSAERLLDDLHFATLRLAPELVEQLAGDEALRNFLSVIAQRCREAGTVVIASNVPNPDAMAMLYNLGIGTVEGPMVGPQSLYHFQSVNRSGRRAATSDATEDDVEDTVAERISHLKLAAA